MKLIGGIGFVLLLGLLFAGCAALKGTQDHVTFTVKDKERVTSSDADGNATSKYLVFGDSETFENTDTMLFGKYNSSDVQGQLDVGETYRCKVYGWRVPFLSMYRNIVSCEAA